MTRKTATPRFLLLCMQPRPQGFSLSPGDEVALFGGVFYPVPFTLVLLVDFFDMTTHG